jgi:sugar lactone lactonase YvrE
MPGDDQGNSQEMMEPDKKAPAPQAEDQAPPGGPGAAEIPAGGSPVVDSIEAGEPPAGSGPPSADPERVADAATTPAESPVEEASAAAGPAGTPGDAESPSGPGLGLAGLSTIMAALRTMTQRDWWTRRRLAGLLAVLLVSLACTTTLFFLYLLNPAPLPDLLPLPVDLDYPPHYLFSIQGLDHPVGVAYSPQEERIYVAEGGDQRMIKAFDREGNLLTTFAPPRTTASQRAPAYLDTDGHGRVFVTDRLQSAVFVYDANGAYLDTILSPDLTLSKYVAELTEGVMTGRTFAFNRFESEVHYYEASSVEHTLPAPSPATWSPLGLRIDAQGRALLTDVASSRHCIRDIPEDVIQAPSWYYFEPVYRVYGETGQDAGQLLFPNSAVADSQGRIHVVDGNNSRISVWDDKGEFLFFYAQGTAEGALNLPRGAAIDEHDRLHVVDAVGQCVRVYDVSGPEPQFLFDFGEWGLGDGEFNYPNDIALDDSGRLYVADREGNRIQVWSY